MTVATRSSPLTLLLVALLACSGKAPQDESSAPDSTPGETGSPCEETDHDRDGTSACDDCDDGDPSVRPGASDDCDGVDQDCDGETDEDASWSTWYTDADGDGAGDDGTAFTSCAPVEGAVSTGGDCDDTDETSAPGLDERCDGLDNDCDGEVDDDVVSRTWYRDDDDDGYGYPSDSVEGCDAPDGYVTVSGDCDDADSTVSPGDDERCNGVDDDCDGKPDDDAIDGEWLYQDADGDGYGDPTEAELSCEATAGWSADNTDCDDDDDSVYPDATELCDGQDQDCDGEIDEGLTVTDWYADADADGWGDADAVTSACAAPTDTVSTSGDCDDGDASINPDGVETCNDLDDDCDGETDDDPVDGLDLYADGDLDGFGDPALPAVLCETSVDWVADDADCDDGDDAVNPAASEICDGVDNDCDGLTDDADDSMDPSGETVWYTDADGDGYGDASSWVSTCAAPTGSARTDDDCDDTDDTVSPAGTEDCNGVDDDCSGSIDDGSACSCDVETYGGGTYLFCDSSQKWTDAQAACAGWGYHLVQIDSTAENTWVVATAVGYKSAKWWAGYNDRSTEGTWVWDGGGTSTYTNWNTSEPNDSGKGEDCMELYRFTSSTWNDADCDTKQRYVCEL